MPMLAHKIALAPTEAQEAYFRRAAGAARWVWNWGLEQWNREYESGNLMGAYALQKKLTDLKRNEFLWLREIHYSALSRPLMNLEKAWRRFFADLKAGRQAHSPKFRKKGKCRDSFFVSPYNMRIEDHKVKITNAGWVKMAEELRFNGRVLGAVVSRNADKWYISFQVEVSDHVYLLKRTGNGVVGVDLGVKAAATLSTGEVIDAPKPLKRMLRRLQIRSRALSRKLEAAKAAAGIPEKSPTPKGIKLPVSNNRKKAVQSLARLHAHIANIRRDFVHKLTTRLCRENQAVVIEDLNLEWMRSGTLSRAISDVGFGLFRTQMEYKARRYGTELIIADRLFPSSRLCSVCGWKNEELTLKDREWTCPECGTHHDRDLNAARNLERLATATALPVASPSSNGGATMGAVPIVVGKVTPVRYDPVEGSGQEGGD